VTEGGEALVSAVARNPRTLPRCAALAAMAVLAALAAAPAAAQEGGYVRVSGSSAEIFNGNLLSTPDSREAQTDLFSRFGSAFESGYLTVPLRLVGRYELDAERYLDHPELNRNVARQEGTLTFDVAPIPRLALNTSGTFLQSYTPTEFNVESQLAVGRTRAERLLVLSSATYSLTQTTKASAGIEYLRDTLAGGFESTTRTARASFEGRTGLRNGYRIDGEIREVAFITDTIPQRSYLAKAGWIYGLDQRTAVELTGGPRFTQGENRITPEITAMLRERFRRADLSAGYWRTNITAIGERGTIDVDRVAINASLRPLEHVTMGAIPSYTRSTRSGAVVPIYSIEGEMAIEATHRLALIASGRLARQEGVLPNTILFVEVPFAPPAPLPTAVIPDRIVSIKIVLTLPRNAAPRPPVDVVTGRRTPKKTEQ
jgi:hypothetical protein